MNRVNAQQYLVKELWVADGVPEWELQGPHQAEDAVAFIKCDHAATKCNLQGKAN